MMKDVKGDLSNRSSMSEPTPRVLPYAPSVSGRIVTHIGADETLLNVTPLRMNWNLLVFGLTALGYGGLLIKSVISRTSLGTWLLNEATTLFVFCIYLSVVVKMYLSWLYDRDTLRVHAGGFHHTHVTAFGRTDLSVSWAEVSVFYGVRGPGTLISPVYFLRIELLNEHPREIVPLELMRGRKPAEIDVVLDHLERWRQSAASYTRSR